MAKAYRIVCLIGFPLFVTTTVSAAQAADSGTTTGQAAFHPKGQATEHKPGLVVWNGTFVGISITETKKGPLHAAKWDCTGEAVSQKDTVYSANGFCLVTDPDGDTINLLWARTDLPAGFAEPKTKGTYLSGTGKYNGIQGYYTFSCKAGGQICNITSGEYKIP
jgi:hypothetical protein